MITIINKSVPIIKEIKILSSFLFSFIIKILRLLKCESDALEHQILEVDLILE
jgi:hypothetical protein